MSITEALYFEKSILTIPITPEQYVLCEKLKSQNAAYVLNFNDLTYDQIIYAVKHIIEDKFKYQQSVNKLRNQLIQNLDRVSPLTRTLNAIEMTLQTGGLEYLKPYSHHLSFWNSILLDVMFTIIIGLITILAIPFLLTCCILKRSYQNQRKLSLFTEQNHRRRCKEFLLSTKTQRTCNNIKHRNSENDDSILWKERRRSSNSEVRERRKRCSSCCNCSVSSSSAPNTPLSKREIPPVNQVSGDIDNI